MSVVVIVAIFESLELIADELEIDSCQSYNYLDRFGTNP
jgi:hypothetical protein